MSTPPGSTGPLSRIALAALLSLALAGPSQASSIAMPAGSKSWIMVGAGDCDDDGQATVDRGHCAADVTHLNQPGDIGHGRIGEPYSITCDAEIMVDAMHGIIQTAGNGSYAFLDMSKIDTFTLNSTTLPGGTVVPITVSFHAVAEMTPGPITTSTGAILGYGGGYFGVRIGNAFNPDPIVIPENTRVNGPLSPGASAQYFISNAPNSTVIPLDLTATHTFDAAVGTPFDLAFYLAARPSRSTIDFSHTARIEFSIPQGTNVTSTGGYGVVTPVRNATWGRLKTIYR